MLREAEAGTPWEAYVDPSGRQKNREGKNGVYLRESLNEKIEAQERKLYCLRPAS